MMVRKRFDILLEMAQLENEKRWDELIAINVAKLLLLVFFLFPFMKSRLVGWPDNEA